MITNEMIEQAREIVRKLEIPARFGVNEDCDCDAEDIINLRDQIYDLGFLNFGDYQVENGISKAVIIFDNLPFVIKIPFNGTWHYEYDYDEANDEWIEADRDFYSFCCARAYDTSDYCWNEYDKIKMAQERGYGQLFPDMEQIWEDKNGRHFYIQEKVQTSRRGSSKEVSENSKARAKSMDTQYKICNDTWRASVIEFYSEALWISFVNWNDAGVLGYLDDMHGSNYGYRFDGTPVLIDVAGFRD